MKCANDNKYSVIRILQEDVLYDRYNWYDELIKNINHLLNLDKIENIFMCTNNLYNKFKNV